MVLVLLSLRPRLCTGHHYLLKAMVHDSSTPLPRNTGLHGLQFNLLPYKAGIIFLLLSPTGRY